MKEKSDNDRAIHASSIVGDPYNAEGAQPINSLKAPGGLLGDHTEGQSRQDIPAGSVQSNPGNYQPGSHYDVQSGGEKELLGQGTTGEGLKDDEYPSLPNVALAGSAGTTDAGQQGSPIDWGSVAPYKYPEYPAQTGTSGDPGNPIPRS